MKGLKLKTNKKFALLVIMIIAVAVIGYFSLPKILVKKRNTLKIRYENWAHWRGRISTMLHLSDNVTVEFIELTNDIFIERVEEKLEEDNLNIFEHTDYPQTDPYPELESIKGLSKTTYSDAIMWYIEETHILIPSNGFYEKTQTFKVFYAYKVRSVK